MAEYPAERVKASGQPGAADPAIEDGHGVPAEDANPRRMMKRYLLLSIAGAMVILLLVSTGFFYIFRNEVVFNARNQSIAVAEAIFAQEQHGFLGPGPDGWPLLGIAAADFPGLDLRIRKYLSAFDMVKVKLYDRDRKIVYSSDVSLIGAVDAANVRLKRVLETGAVDSQVVGKDEIADLQGQQRIEVDVVETYVPVRVDAEIVGAFEVYTDVSASYGRVARTLRIWILGLLAVLVAVFGALHARMRYGARQVARLQDQLQRFASIDALTGLYNRRHLLVVTGSEKSRLDRALRDREPTKGLCFIMMDIDHFKGVNDTHGHQAGDEVLRQMAQRVRGTLRPYDVAGRYGGEEFLVVLPDTRLEEAGVVAERIRAQVEETPFAIDGGTLRITASFGVAHSADIDESVESAINRADQGLYKAKAEGRNKVVSVG